LVQTGAAGCPKHGQRSEAVDRLKEFLGPILGIERTIIRIRNNNSKGSRMDNFILVSSGKHADIYGSKP
jgi:hypothetical protein